VLHYGATPLYYNPMQTHTGKVNLITGTMSANSVVTKHEVCSMYAHDTALTLLNLDHVTIRRSILANRLTIAFIIHRNLCSLTKNYFQQ
jgi:hypothetical protein